MAVAKPIYVAQCRTFLSGKIIPILCMEYLYSALVKIALEWVCSICIKLLIDMRLWALDSYVSFAIWDTFLTETK